jgi:adenylate cyclase
MAAVLAADVAGYSRLMGDDEEATIAALERARAVFRESISHHDGRVVDTAGDSVLAVFESVVEAVRSARSVQETLAARNADAPEDRRMLFRIGIHFGDIVEQDDGTIYGDGVNIAARLESLAEPGGLTVSSSVHEHIDGKLGVEFSDLGEQEVKNIARPVHAWRVAAGDRPARSAGFKTKRWAAVTVAAACLMGVLAWQFWPEVEPGSGERTEDKRFPVIAVVPFENQSGDANQDYFAMGLTDDLITRLVRFTDYTVISRDSTMQYVGAAADPRQVRADLGASFVVYGSVRKLEDAVRITVRVADGKTGQQLWSEKFEGDLTVEGLFDIQDRITEQAASRIGDWWGVVRSAERASVSTTVPTQNLDAYDCVLRMYTFWDGPTPELHAELRDCFERAVETDPTYSTAWAQLANIYRVEHTFGFNALPNPLDRMFHAAKSAIHTNPDGWQERTILAQAYFFRHDNDQFHTWAQRAIAADPPSASGLADLGLFLNLAGYVDEGMPLLLKAIKLNPDHPSWYAYGLSCGYYLLGEYEAGLTAALKLDWGTSWDYMYRALFYAQLDRMDEARRELEMLVEVDPEYIPKVWDRYRIYNLPDESIHQFLEGLRLAGADVPKDPRLTQ